MAKALQGSSFRSNRSTAEGELHHIVSGIAERSARLLGTASLMALGASILIQPAFAQAAAAPSTTAASSQEADAAARDGDPPAASSTADSSNTITVTGTLIRSNENSPTPITAVETAEM